MAFHAQNDHGDSPSDFFSRNAKAGSKPHGRRSRTEMMLDILESLKEGTEGPTRIMYRANLSWSVLQELLGHLVKRGLIKPVEGTRKLYQLTPKGSDVLSWSSRVADEIGG